MTKKLTKDEYKRNRRILLPFLGAYIALFVIAIYAPQWYWVYLGALLLVTIVSILPYWYKQKELQKI